MNDQTLEMNSAVIYDRGSEYMITSCIVYWDINLQFSFIHTGFS